MRWTHDDIPDQRGTIYVITGANSGIGFEAALALARRGAHVVMACRSPERGRAALEALQARVPGASVEVAVLDLASLASVRRFAAEFAGRRRELHGLVNNAGIMAIPRAKTEDGFEMQLGTNHLGHFALTGLLLPLLLAAPGSRIVNVSSAAHRIGRMHWDDLTGERHYEPWSRYGQSKLANLLFTYELARRLEAAGASTRALACHPGYAATALQHKGAEMKGSKLEAALMSLGNSLLAQSAEMGALPTLRALTDPSAKNGEYYGPGGFLELRGPPVRVCSSKASHNRSDQARLWAESERLTGVRYEALERTNDAP